MANTDSPMGFNPVGKIGSGPSQKAAEYDVTNDAIFQGDAVQIAGNSGSTTKQFMRALFSQKGCYSLRTLV